MGSIIYVNRIQPFIDFFALFRYNTSVNRIDVIGGQYTVVYGIVSRMLAGHLSDKMSGEPGYCAIQWPGFVIYWEEK